MFLLKNFTYKIKKPFLYIPNLSYPSKTGTTSWKKKSETATRKGFLFMFINVGMWRSSLISATACIKGSNLSKEASGESLHTLQRQNTEILKQRFPEKEYQGLSPNFHIYASVSDLYIPTIPTLLEEICRPILGLYKSLTDAIPRKGIHKWDFRCSVASAMRKFLILLSHSIHASIKTQNIFLKIIRNKCIFLIIKIEHPSVYFRVYAYFKWNSFQIFLGKLSHTIHVKKCRGFTGNQIESFCISLLV
jgi:hypothetical protein